MGPAKFAQFKSIWGPRGHAGWDLFCRGLYECFRYIFRFPLIATDNPDSGLSVYTDIHSTAAKSRAHLVSIGVTLRPWSYAGDAGALQDFPMGCNNLMWLKIMKEGKGSVVA